MKKIEGLLWALSLTVLLMTISSGALASNQDIQIIIDGTKLDANVPAKTINGRTMVPMRAIFEAMGAKVNWENNTRTAIGIKDNKQIRLQIGNSKATINGEEFSLDSPAVIVNKNTFVPVRFIAESFGADVKWDGATRTVTIKSGYNRIINLSDKEHRKMNIFFSNFSEAYFPNYDSNYPNVEKLIDFAFTHNIINNNNYIKFEDYSMYIDKVHIEKTISKYFGFNLNHGSIGEYQYRNGRYYKPAASGESYGTFSQLDKLIDNKDGTYSAEISIYYDHDDPNFYGVKSHYYNPKITWGNKHNSYEHIGNAEAIVLPDVIDGENTYYLLKYKEK